MQADEKKSKAFGIPYTVIIFVFVATLPNLVSDHFTRQDIAANRQEIINLEKQPVVKSVTPSITISSTPATPSAVPTVGKSITNYPQRSFTTPSGVGR